MIGLENSTSISLLIFTSLSFNSLSLNSIKSFSNSKRLLFTFKNCFFGYCLSISSQYFRFYNLSFPSLHINEKIPNFLKNEKYYMSSDFK